MFLSIFQNFSPFKNDIPPSIITLNQNTSLREYTQFGLGDFKEMEFDPIENWPTAGENATPREKEIVDLAMQYARKHTIGLYNAVLRDYNKLGWISEHMVLLDPKTRVYLGKEGNLFDEMADLAKTLTPNENRLLNEAFSIGNRIKNAPENFVLNADNGFNYDHVKNILQPVKEYFSKKKGNPRDFMLKGVKYPSTYFRTPGVQPNNRELPAAFRERFTYHSSLSILKDAHHLAVDPEGRERVQGRFEVDKSNGRRIQWQQKINASGRLIDASKILDAGNNIKLTIPEYDPELPSGSFDGIRFPQGTKKIGCLVDFENKNGKQPLQVLAAVAINPQNKNCLMEYHDYSVMGNQKKYGNTSVSISRLRQCTTKQASCEADEHCD